MNAYLLNHEADWEWAMKNALHADFIAHEDYLPDLLRSAIPSFFDYSGPKKEIDGAISYLSFNWNRDSNGCMVCDDDILSISDAFSVGMHISIVSICREYFALEYWLTRYEKIFVSCNESEEFHAITKKFPGRIAIYDPEHRYIATLTSMATRALALPEIDWRAKILRYLQAPFLCYFHDKTLALHDWTMTQFTAQNSGWIGVNSLYPWKGAYERNVPACYLMEADRTVPLNFNNLISPLTLFEVLLRIDVLWDKGLLQLLASQMNSRYGLYRDYFVKVVAKYQDLLDSYKPSELIICTEFFEPYLIATNVAKSKNIKVSWLVDGYNVIDLEDVPIKRSIGPSIFDRIYAIASQHQFRLMRNKPELQELVTITPPLLDNHVIDAHAKKLFDVIIMTWIPNDLNLDGRNGSRPTTLLDAIKVSLDAGFQKIAIKIKHHTEKVWLLAILENTNYKDRVVILEGKFCDHVKSAHRVIGGISSAVGEAAYHDIPYYVYEPVANGYGAQQLSSAVILTEDGIARTPSELLELLKSPEGSVKKNKELLFGVKLSVPKWSWDQTRELYTSWTASWPNRSGIKDVLQWRGFPLWWCTNLVHKDTAVDFSWYKCLHDRLCGQATKKVVTLSHLSVCWGIVKSLVRYLGAWALLKLLPNNPAVSGERVWFHSLESNFINAPEGFCDRMYEQTPIDDENFFRKSAYIVRIGFKAADYFHPFIWRNKVASLDKKLRREVVILNKHLLLKDIMQIHFSLISNYYKFTKLATNFRRSGVRIGHAEFSDILIAEMQKSFVKILPWSLSYAAMFEEWLKFGGDKTLVTYGETLAPMRGVYYLTRKNSPNHRWISIQHATVYKNKLGFYHRRSEFENTGNANSKGPSPMPDYYFVHGSQFYDILTQFYPSEKVRVIGCLKYDSLYRLYNKASLMSGGKVGERIILLAPSVGDEEIIIKMLIGIDKIPGWRIVMSKHPTVSNKTIDDLLAKNSIKLNIDFDLSKSTTQWIRKASLVVCSYSSIALESLLAGVPSVRVLNLDQPPMVDKEEGISYVTTQHDFLNVVRELDLTLEKLSISSEVANTLEKFFFKFDGQASSRFWVELNRLNDLPIKRVLGL